MVKEDSSCPHIKSSGEGESSRLYLLRKKIILPHVLNFLCVYNFD